MRNVSVTLKEAICLNHFTFDEDKKKQMTDSILHTHIQVQKK